MSNEEPTVQPQGAWVREVVRELTGDEPETQSPVAAATPDPPAGYVAPAARIEPPRLAPTTSTATARRETGHGSHPLGHGASPFFDSLAFSSRARNGEVWPRRVARWVVGNVRSGHTDARLVELLEAVRRPVTTGRRIGVTGVRGGVGTTTVALLIASVLAVRRDDAVLAVDADPELGSLFWRAGLDREQPTEGSTDPAPTHPTARDQLDALVPRTSHGLWVLPGSADESDVTPSAGTRAATAHQDLSPGLHRELGRFFGVTVYDCGTELSGPRTPDAALPDTHAAIVVAAATVDGVRAAHQSLQLTSSGRRQSQGPLAHPLVVLVSRTPRTEGLDLARTIRYLEQSDRTVLHLPYDRHLAAGSQVDLSRLADSTVLATTDLAARILTLARERGDNTGRTR